MNLNLSYLKMLLAATTLALVAPAFSQISLLEKCNSLACFESSENTALDGSSIDDVAVPAPFEIPSADYVLRKDYSHIDPQNIIAKVVLQNALKFYDLNLNRIKVQQYITIIDFTFHASQRRLFFVNMLTGEVKPMLVSVGKNSDPDGDGIANSFSNEPGSNQSSLGFYLTDDEYMGGNGRSMRLHGLSATNSNALTRYIVVHGAAYVSEPDNHAGRSLGCPAVDFKNLDDLIDKTKNGSLMYIWHSSI